MKRSPLNRSAPMRRTAFKRADPSTCRAVLTRAPTPITPLEREGRRLVRARSGGMCEVCGRRPATNWHHRVARSQGGRWSAANGLDVCGSGTTGCHGMITVNPAMAKEAKSGWSVYPTQDPAAVPVRLAGRGLVLLSDDGKIHRVEEREAA